MKMKPLAISIGCPCGIGPEVSVVGAARSRDAACLLVGDPTTIRRAAELRGVASKRLIEVTAESAIARLEPGIVGIWMRSAALTAPAAPGHPNEAAGTAQLAWIDEATRLVEQGLSSALVTGPVSKLAIATSGAPGASLFRGHTEHLGDHFGASSVTMAFASRELVTALVTTHLAIADVPDAITSLAVAETADRLARLVIALGVRRPKIAVAALNPHAGEGGLLGTEEIERIAPGVERARTMLAADNVRATLEGPIGAETAFRLAAKGSFDGVVAMYHDQATIPSKLLGFGEAVNVTLGLPIVRTSVDHGTAYDLAGTGKADARGMREAIDLAARLVASAKRRRA
jgi:4-hydroxythreonine-4-phosphate dehydrogenase